MHKQSLIRRVLAATAAAGLVILMGGTAVSAQEPEPAEDPASDPGQPADIGAPAH